MSEHRLNRVLSKPLTGILLKTPLTPNQVTLISLSCGLLAGFFFSRGTYLFSLAGAASYQLAVILDNCDGEIARAKNMRSVFGGWLDVATDFLTDLSLFLGIGFGMKQAGVPGPVVLFMVLCLSGALIHLALVVLEKIKGFGPAVFTAPTGGPTERKNVLLDIFDALREGEASWFVVFFTVIHQVSVLLWAGGIYMQLLWITAFLSNFRRLFQGARV